MNTSATPRDRSEASRANNLSISRLESTAVGSSRISTRAPDRKGSSDLDHLPVGDAELVDGSVRVELDPEFVESHRRLRIDLAPRDYPTLRRLATGKDVFSYV
jgi:hypothetical protein